VHENWSDCKAALSNRRIFAITTKGSTRHSEVAFQAGDVFVFGPETRGLPADILEEFSADLRLRLPMLANSRSLNLSNSAAVLLYEAWRQIGFTEGV
jgi:tRNA (cytidine/uridine-2'-O-)-methyltransferase